MEDAFEPPKSVGSNNWVIAGSRTRSGMPILANDPHRAIAAPSLRYWVHLVAPGWNVIGAGEPTLPGVSIGHNEHGAWGLTTFGADHEDLMVYETDPDDPLRYRYAGGWKRMEVEHDRIQVRGEPDVEVEHRYTVHGPVLREDPDRHLAYALRAAWLEPGGAPYLASLRMDQATTWEEFREACTWNHTPSENMIWADTSGTIGYQAASIRPLRRTWSGLLPVPGDGSYEWDGWLPITDLPSEVNPERGFVATANQFLFPPDYPHQAAMHYTWPAPYRAQRISEVLAASDDFDVAAVERLQNDDVTIPARLLTPLLAGMRLDGALEDARQLLLRWGHEMHVDSPAAGLYQTWEWHLGDAFLHLVLPRPEERSIGLLLSLDRMVEQLREPDELFGDDPARRPGCAARVLPGDGDRGAHRTVRPGSPAVGVGAAGLPPRDGAPSAVRRGGRAHAGTAGVRSHGPAAATARRCRRPSRPTSSSSADRSRSSSTWPTGMRRWARTRQDNPATRGPRITGTCSSPGRGASTSRSRSAGVPSKR